LTLSIEDRVSPFDIFLLGMVVVLVLICIRERTKPKEKGGIRWTIGPVSEKNNEKK
jgi:hypothetical protein